MSSSSLTPEAIAQEPRTAKYWPVPNVDVIYHNMHAASDFRTIRAALNGTVEEELIRAANHVKNGCFKIVSISASKNSFVVVCSTPLSSEELMEKGFMASLKVENSNELKGE
jgi:pectin methylesterase-like acyl-CoA thioesterase